MSLNKILDKINRRVYLGSLATLILLLLVINLFQTTDFSNELNLNVHNIENSINIPIQTTTEFTNISKRDLQDLRSRYFQQIPNILSNKYQLRDNVFGLIKDESLWLTELNYYFFGEDNKAHPGRPAEIFGLFNPLLLIYPDFLGWSIRGSLKWNLEKVNEQQGLTQTNFPIFPQPQKLLVNMPQKEITVTYDLTGYQQIVNPWLLNPLDIKDLSFISVSYNAKDFGFDWYKLSSESINISEPDTAPRRLDVAGIWSLNSSACGSIESECNMRIDLDQGSKIRVSNIPAEAVYYLWNNEPSNPEQAPDLKFKILLQ